MNADIYIPINDYDQKRGTRLGDERVHGVGCLIVHKE